MPHTFRVHPLLFAVLLVLGGATRAGAQDTAGAANATDASADGAGAFAGPAADAVPALRIDADALRRLQAAAGGQAAATAPAPVAAPRALLPALYAGLGTLQALDAHSTLRAVNLGYAERNPMMRWAAGHPAALITVKAAATVGTIAVAERIRRRHPKRAVAFIAAVNAAYAFVVVHNYRALARAD
jgi:hypothetical protein